MPEFVNSVICCGSSAPSWFLSRLYQPKPFTSPKSFEKPAMFVDSARSAEHAITSGRPYFCLPCALSHAPNFAKPFPFATFSPGATNSVFG